MEEDATRNLWLGRLKRLWTNENQQELGKNKRKKKKRRQIASPKAILKSNTDLLVRQWVSAHRGQFWMSVLQSFKMTTLFKMKQLDLWSSVTAAAGSSYSGLWPRLSGAAHQPSVDNKGAAFICTPVDSGRLLCPLVLIFKFLSPL